MADWDAPEVPYRRIYESLRERIIREELQPGDKLPSSRELEAEFNAASHTVQRAVRALREARLVDSIPGSATRVREQEEVVERSASYTRSPLPGAGVPYRARSELVELGPTAAPSYVARRLGIDRGDEVMLRKRHMVREGRVVEIVSSYYPLEIAEGTELAGDKPLRGGSPQALERLGFPAEGPPAEWVFTRLPLLSEARVLRLPMTNPIFRLLRTVFAAGLRPVEVIEMVMDGDRNVLRYDL